MADFMSDSKTSLGPKALTPRNSNPQPYIERPKLSGPDRMGSMVIQNPALIESAGALVSGCMKHVYASAKRDISSEASS